MVLFDLADHSEFCGELRETFLFGGFCKTLIHIGPLVVFAVRSGPEICFCIADAHELLEPHFCVFFFVIGCLQEECSYLLVALFFRDRCEIGVLISHLRLAGEGLLQIFLGFGACILVCHRNTSYVH